MTSPVSIIIVTHNSQAMLAECLTCVGNQSMNPARVVVVDSGSDDPSYLDRWTRRSGYYIYKTANIGFAAANNLGMKFIDKGSRYVFFVNPDTFMENDCLETAVGLLNQRQEAAIATGILRGYDIKNKQASGTLDSTGIFRTWYGRWYDRDQGSQEKGHERTEAYVPAVCGAFMACRIRALLPELPEIFDESFFMYKEDIELCLRLRKKGWKLLFSPEIKAYHCRGWQRERRLIDSGTKLMAARNEIKLNIRHPSLYILWALLKYFLVRVAKV